MREANKLKQTTLELLVEQEVVGVHTIKYKRRWMSKSNQNYKGLRTRTKRFKFDAS